MGVLLSLHKRDQTHKITGFGVAGSIPWYPLWYAVAQFVAHNAIFKKLISWKSDGKFEPSYGKTTGGLALGTLIKTRGTSL